MAEPPVELRARRVDADEIWLAGASLAQLHAQAAAAQAAGRPLTETKVRQITAAALDDVLEGVEGRAAGAVAEAAAAAAAADARIAGRLDELAAALENAETARLALAAHTARLEGELVEARADLEDAQATLGLTRSGLHEAHELLGAGEDGRAALEARLAGLLDDVAEMRRALSAHGPSLALIEQDMAELKVACSTYAMSALYRLGPGNGRAVGPGQAETVGWDRPAMTTDAITLSRGELRVAKAGHYRISASLTLLAPEDQTIGELDILVDGRVVEQLPLPHLRSNPHRFQLEAAVHMDRDSVASVRLVNKLEAGSSPSRVIQIFGSPELGLLAIHSVRLDRR